MREIIFAVIGAVVAGLITAAAEKFFGALSALFGPEIPPNAVVAFHLEECPEKDGWVDYKEAYGRFIRGIDMRKDKETDPEGKRLPGSPQEDEYEEHDHAQPGDVYNPGGEPNAAWVSGAKRGEQLAYGHRNPPPTGKRGGEETRPKNVALLFCRKT